MLVDELQMWRHSGEHFASGVVAIIISEWDDSDLSENSIVVGNKSSWSLKLLIRIWCSVVNEQIKSEADAGEFWNEAEKIGEYWLNAKKAAEMTRADSYWYEDSNIPQFHQS